MSLLICSLCIDVYGLIFPSFLFCDFGQHGTCTDLTFNNMDAQRGGLTERLWQCARSPGWKRRSGWGAGRWPRRNPAPCGRCCPRPAPGWTRVWQCEGSGSMVSPAGRPVWRWSGSNSGHWGQRGRRRRWGEGWAGQWQSEDEQRRCKIHARFFRLEPHACNREGRGHVSETLWQKLHYYPCQRYKCGAHHNETLFLTSPHHSEPHFHQVELPVSHRHRPLPPWGQHKGCSVSLHLCNTVCVKLSPLFLEVNRSHINRSPGPARSRNNLKHMWMALYEKDWLLT